MRIIAAIALYSLLCLLLGCYRRSHPHVNYYVPGECKPSLTLLDCDYSSPSHCAKVVASFKAGCEQLSTK